MWESSLAQIGDGEVPYMRGLNKMTNKQGTKMHGKEMCIAD